MIELRPAELLPAPALAEPAVIAGCAHAVSCASGAAPSYGAATAASIATATASAAQSMPALLELLPPEPVHGLGAAGCDNGIAAAAAGGGRGGGGVGDDVQAAPAAAAVAVRLGQAVFEEAVAVEGKKVPVTAAKGIAVEVAAVDGGCGERGHAAVIAAAATGSAAGREATSALRHATAAPGVGFMGIGSSYGAESAPTAAVASLPIVAAGGDGGGETEDLEDGEIVGSPGAESGGADIGCEGAAAAERGGLPAREGGTAGSRGREAGLDSGEDAPLDGVMKLATSRAWKVDHVGYREAAAGGSGSGRLAGQGTHLREAGGNSEGRRSQRGVHVYSSPAVYGELREGASGVELAGRHGKRGGYAGGDDEGLMGGYHEEAAAGPVLKRARGSNSHLHGYPQYKVSTSGHVSEAHEPHIKETNNN